MQEASELWHTYWNSLNRKFEYTATIGGVEYTDENVTKIELHRALMTKGKFSIGNVISTRLMLAARDKGIAVPAMAEIKLYMRLNGEIGPTEWIPKGVYYVDESKKNDFMYDFDCLDAVTRLEQPFLDGVPSDFSMSMKDAVNSICLRCALELDFRTKIRGDYSIYNPLGLTMREALGYIASAHGGNFILNDAGQLRLVRLGDAGGEFAVERSMERFAEVNIPIKIEKIKMYYTENDYYESGEATNAFNEFSIYNEWATQEIADDLYSLLNGYEYNPVSADGAYINPIYELGDAVTINGIKSVILDSRLILRGLTPSDITAPAESITDHEYPYRDSNERKLARETARLRNEMAGILLDCEHESTVGKIVTIRIMDEKVMMLRERGTYQFNVKHEIPNFAIVRVITKEGVELASREWLYQNGKPVQKKHFSVETNARVQIMDNMTYFFNCALPGGGDEEAVRFQIANGAAWLSAKGILTYQIGLRGDL